MGVLDGFAQGLSSGVAAQGGPAALARPDATELARRDRVGLLRQALAGRQEVKAGPPNRMSQAFPARPASPGVSAAPEQPAPTAPLMTKQLEAGPTAANYAANKARLGLYEDGGMVGKDDKSLKFERGGMVGRNYGKC